MFYIACSLPYVDSELNLAKDNDRKMTTKFGEEILSRKIAMLTKIILCR